MRGSEDDISVVPDTEVVITSKQGPNDDFRVMELEFTVTPETPTDSVTVTVVFTLENGTDVTVTRVVLIFACITHTSKQVNN